MIGAGLDEWLTDVGGDLWSEGERSGSGGGLNEADGEGAVDGFEKGYDCGVGACGGSIKLDMDGEALARFALFKGDNWGVLSVLEVMVMFDVSSVADRIGS